MISQKIFKKILDSFNDLELDQPQAQEVFEEISNNIEKLMMGTYVSWNTFIAWQIGKRMNFYKFNIFT